MVTIHFSRSQGLGESQRVNQTLHLCHCACLCLCAGNCVLVSVVKFYFLLTYFSRYVLFSARLVLFPDRFLVLTKDCGANSTAASLTLGQEQTMLKSNRGSCMSSATKHGALFIPHRHPPPAAMIQSPVCWTVVLAKDQGINGEHVVTTAMSHALGGNVTPS